MSYRVSGTTRRLRPAARAALLLGLIGIIAGPLAPLATAAGGLTVTTPFPAVVAEPGATASFNLTLTVPTAERVDLKTGGVPDGWTARFRGGGLTIDGAFVEPKAPPTITLDVEIPDGAPAGDQHDHRDRDAAAAGPTCCRCRSAWPTPPRATSRSTADFATLKGPASTTFTYNLTLHNDTSAEITFTMDAVGPDGWTVAAKPAGQAQATSTTVAAGSTGSITVTATPPDGRRPPGAYPDQGRRQRRHQDRLDRPRGRRSPAPTR